VRFAEGTGTLDRALDATAQASFVGYAFAGLYTVHATYLGDPHFNTSTDSVDTRVNKATTTTTLTISPNPATPGAAISSLAIVGIQPPGDVAPSGSLQFTIDGTPVGAAIGLGGGVVGYQGNLTAPPGDRTYLVAVGYSGDEDTEPSSASVAVTVSAPAPALPNTAASVPSVVLAHLSTMAPTLTSALRLRGFAALTTTIETIAAGPGLLEQKVYAPPAARAATAAATKRVMIASGRHRFTGPGTGTLRLKLTSAGRWAIRHPKSLKLTIVTRFTPTAGKAVVATKRLTVRAKPKRSATRAREARGWRLVGVRWPL
jgi:large repetitive protein